MSQQVRNGCRLIRQKTSIAAYGTTESSIGFYADHREEIGDRLRAVESPLPQPDDQ